jgi:ATP-dependent DNA helicase RecG
MKEHNLKSILHNLLQLEAENEIVEFKEAKKSFDFEKLGKYFSALSNEANLLNKNCAWLVFGVENKKHKIVGTNYRITRGDLDNLKKEIADATSNRITFVEIHEVQMTEGRVVMFQIPPAPKGIPVSFNGHFYGRDGESLVPLNVEEFERIRSQNTNNDWSAEIIPYATIDDLDEMAIAKARIEFKKRNPKYQDEVDNWDNVKFLDKAKITTQGNITRTAMILLGKEESEHFLGSCVKILWDLRALDNQSKDHKVFSIPFLLTIDEVYAKIRNLIYRYMPDGTLYPDEILRYDPFNIREPLNNAIAHQDYTKKARINVIEFDDDHLVFSNLGSFLPKSVEFVVLSDTPQESYRNPFLVEAMKTLNMIETQGGGIKKMYNFQKKRYFPMPDYDFADGRVKVIITGKIINEDFARILSRNPNMGLEEIIMLDKVQKKKSLTDEEIIQLKKTKFIEGRKPNIYLSKIVIEPTKDPKLKADYIKNRGLDDQFLKKYIFDYIKMGKVSKKDIDKFIWGKLPDVLDDNKKKNKIKNILQELRKEEKILSSQYGYWEIVD